MDCSTFRYQIGPSEEPRAKDDELRRELGRHRQDCSDCRRIEERHSTQPTKTQGASQLPPGRSRFADSARRAAAWVFPRGTTTAKRIGRTVLLEPHASIALLVVVGLLSFTLGRLSNREPGSGPGQGSGPPAHSPAPLAPDLWAVESTTAIAWLASDLELYRRSLASVSSLDIATPVTGAAVAWVRVNHSSSKIFDEEVRPLLDRVFERAPESGGSRQLIFLEELAPYSEKSVFKDGVATPEEAREVVLSGQEESDRRQEIRESQVMLESLFERKEPVPFKKNIAFPFHGAQARWLEERRPLIQFEMPTADAGILEGLAAIHRKLGAHRFEKDHDFDSFIAHWKLGTALRGLAWHLKDLALGDQIRRLMNDHPDFHVVAVIGAEHDAAVALRGVRETEILATPSIESWPQLDSTLQLEAACLAHGIEGLDTETVLRNLYLWDSRCSGPELQKKAVEAKTAELTQRGETWEQLYRDAAKIGQWPSAE